MNGNEMRDETVLERQMVAIGRAIAEGRECLDMTQGELARIAHVSPLTVRRVESGELWPFTIGTLERIAAVVGVELEFDLVPRFEELVVLAATTERPVRVLVPTVMPDAF